MHKIPKKTKTNKTVGLQKPSQTPSSSGQVTRDKNKVVTISVQVKPGSEQNAITEAVGVAIAAPPTDGQANADLVLELKRREAKSFWTRAPDPEKIVKVTGSLTQEQVLDRLRQEASR